MRRVALVHQIFEGDSPDPVLEHRFFGRTREEALGVFEAHMKTDSFLRACQTRGHFRDFDCSTRTWWEEARSS